MNRLFIATRKYGWPVWRLYPKSAGPYRAKSSSGRHFAPLAGAATAKYNNTVPTIPTLPLPIGLFSQMPRRPGPPHASAFVAKVRPPVPHAPATMRPIWACQENLTSSRSAVWCCNSSTLQPDFRMRK